MKSPAFVLGLVALLVAGAGGFAADRGFSARTARAEREEAQGQLEKAVKLAAEHPRVFGPEAVVHPAGDSTLKTVAQETATSRQVTIGFLSESERDADKGRRERQVIIRLVNAGHPNLIRFLQDLESHGGGARVKEIHVRPSREVPDAYEEAEIVLSKVSGAPADKKP
jgi:hypothetical protein